MDVQSTDLLVMQSAKRNGARIIVGAYSDRDSSPLDFMLSLDRDGTLRSVLAKTISDEDLQSLLTTFWRAKRPIHLHATSDNISLSTLNSLLRRVDKANINGYDVTIVLHTD